MLVRDGAINQVIEKIGDHYKSNLGNRYLRPAFLKMSLENSAWDLIDSMTEKSSHFVAAGYHLDEIYDRVVALARFVYHARKEVQPNLRRSVGENSGIAGTDKILRDMSINNFESNVSLLADYVNELYVRTVTIDKENNPDSPVFEKVKDLTHLGRYLTSALG